MKPLTFLDVTPVDFAQMEGKAIVNKARVIGHEADKLWRGEQGVFKAIAAAVDTILEPTEQYYDFPPSGQFHIEREG